MPSFNLIDEPFIPCLTLDGKSDEYGLKHVLQEAHKIAEIRDGSPLVTMALHRLLLAILHRCLQGPKKSSARLALRNAGSFNADRIGAYFEKWHDRFDVSVLSTAGIQHREPERDQSTAARVDLRE
jgi:CRISPR system Cascade subunit CasA